jgi:hypothetical protein
MAETTFDLDEIQSFSPRLPNGIVIARLTSGDITQTQAGDDQFSATFEVRKGEHLGTEFTSRYSLTPWVSADGKAQHFGLARFKEEADRIGAKGYKTKLTATEFKKLYHTLFAKKDLRIVITERADKKKKRDDGTPVMWKEYKIIGLAEESIVGGKALDDGDDE